MKKTNPYILSLDIGTASIGYACMDLDFNILKYHDKDAIGVLTFEGADTAAERRGFRTSRRRKNRRIKRLGLLQEVLAPLVKNPNFYQLLNLHKWKNSNEDFKHRSLSEVLKNLGKNPKTYPTIYHLQQEIQNHPEKKFEPELIFLSLYHLVKYRGHFLFNNLSFDKGKTVDNEAQLSELLIQYQSINPYEDTISNKDIKVIIDTLNDDYLTRNDKFKDLKKKVSKSHAELFKMLAGLKFKQSNLFENMENAEDIKETTTGSDSISLSEDYYENLSEFLTDEQLNFIESANTFFMGIMLDRILKGASSISAAKVRDYDNFKNQLKLIKDIVYQNKYDKYHEFFVTSKENMNAYKKNPDAKNFGKLSKFDQYLIHPKDQYSKLMKDLKEIVPKAYTEVLNLIEEQKFLVLQNTIDNASIPYQNNVFEAVNILRNQQKYYPEITEEMIDKVINLITFRIPYYVGPITNKNGQSDFAWMVRKSDGQTLPWSFDKVIDKSKSAEKFIRRMTSKCTYLLEEDVLPKNSLLYQEMEVLNELNNVQLRGENEPKNRIHRLEPKVKQFIYHKLFQKKKNVTHKDIIELLQNSEYGSMINKLSGQKVKVFGTQNESKFATKLSTYNDMKSIFGSVESRRDMIEQLVLWITIFEDKAILKEKIQEKYPNITENQLSQIIKLNYSGWGRLSEKLLTEEVNNRSVIDLMYNTENNFMEIITDKTLGFVEFIKNSNKVKNAKISYKDVAELRTSPALKKGIWNAIKMVREISGIFGVPEKIIIEFATEDQVKGKRQKSRSELWDDLVKKHNLKRNKEFKDLFEELKVYPEFDFSNPKLWLYIHQNGKCMYSKQPIDLGKLISDKNDSLYEIDHILPRTFVKDDSINNKVLVIKSTNQKKSGDKMPLEIFDNHTLVPFWKLLHENDLISSSKLSKLMKKEFNDLDKEGFIQRQLVETRQIISHVSDFLTEEYPSTTVVPMKANVVSELRRKFDIPKIRQLNDWHHAVDAYLNGFVYQAARVLYPKVNLFEFNFKWEKVREKWKQLGEFTENNKQREFFLFKRMEKYVNEYGERMISKLIFDLDNFKFNYSRKVESTESAFYKQSAFSPKNTVALYESDKSNTAVYKEMKNKRGIVVSYAYLKKDKEIIDYGVFNETVFDYVNNLDKDMNARALKIVQKTFPKLDIKKAQYLFSLNKGDAIFVNSHPFLFVSAKERINAKQLEFDIHMQRKLKQALNPYNKMTELEKTEVYDQFAEKVVMEFENSFGIKSRNEKVELIRNQFNESDKSNEALIQCILEVLKMTKVSAERSAKLKIRWNGQSPNTFIDIKNNTEIQYKSITGLKTIKPKSIFKLAESKNEL
ncbi:CRISPR-associated protein, Csn1 family [Staphylococcus piscifermentans]|uniref:CRISPR-associated endonuclease Cas9 n=2 Tax=Staphylococcus piscifermentans TaxID=70258 RepID=A0A239U749_9STAP|nr:type II CRISPR RNA-guided endonuclease Cas9 [Staphylococcus piscifermentans]GEP84191.1 CRISPR-associated endonuclease Cas9 [Staphylococcus piscifermentans]SNV05770.1 CRISPR-associated protein, Csn1 family [Staphylococcus piscifermentans]